jgi:hypothetical protein
MTGKMTPEGQAKFKKRFNDSRTATAFSNLSNHIDLLEAAIKDSNSDDIQYLAGLMRNSIDMILRCNS